MIGDIRPTCNRSEPNPPFYPLSFLSGSNSDPPTCACSVRLIGPRMSAPWSPCAGAPPPHIRPPRLLLLGGGGHTLYRSTEEHQKPLRQHVEGAGMAHRWR